MAFTEKINARSSIKSWHPHWKHKLRENCLQRVKTNRSQILWKIRLGGEAFPVSREKASLAFSDILVDEIDRLRQRTNGEAPHAQSDPDAMIWEYEPSEALSQLKNDDYEELMIAMQNILYDDLRTENEKRDSVLLEEFEKSCEQEDRALSMMLEQLQNSEEDEVICPICKAGKLQQNQHLIFCSCGHLRLDVQHEKVNLHFLRKRLEELLQQHHDSGCQSQPVFCTDHRFSMTALYIQCSSCETFELVL
ncbi:hypothetical protein GOP47_0017501 [Adiantum capillus-veneris]|uniref:RPA-interacting protein n=1 Tax=Adiantum capillus-veneris TaxID=13818 RepID=A0A9D4UFG0_ADICA|nr:hypothetical protein GOP47_0017501 [Adiantum capillus-veneris]